jgi:hypothetical protein
MHRGGGNGLALASGLQERKERRVVCSLKIVAAVLGAFAVAAVPVLADDIFSIKVHPGYCFAPCFVRITVRLEPHDAHRELAVEADGRGYYRRSVIQLDGSEEPAVHNVVWKSLPMGVYDVRATLKSSNGAFAQATDQVQVIGP